MEQRFFHSSFVKLLVAQTQVAFNDNATKLVLIELVNLALPMEQAMRYVSVTSLLLVAPFVLFAPLAGWLNDRFARREVIRWSLWLQIAVMAFIAAAIFRHDLPLLMTGFFLLAVQSTLFSPAKRAILGELQPAERIQAAVGWADMLCIGAILGGSLAGGAAVDFLATRVGDSWTAAALSVGGLFLLCVIAAVVFRAMPRGAGRPGHRFSSAALIGHGRLLKVLWRTPGVLRPAMGESAFYFTGGVLMIVLAQMARLANPDGTGAGSETGILMALLGIGIGIGSVTAGTIRQKQSRTGVIPFAAAGMAICLALLGFTEPGWVRAAALVAAGTFGGLFIVPVSSALLERSPEESRGRILAASSLCSSLAGVVAVGAQWILGQMLGLSPAGQLLFLAGFLLITAAVAMCCLSREALTFAVLGVGRLLYRVRPMHAERVPSEGGVLMVCNHVSYADTIALCLASPRPIRFLSYEGFFDTPILGALLRAARAIPVSNTRSKDAIRAAAECVRAGEVVCIFPEGQLTRTGSLMELKRGYELIARQADCPVLPVALDGLWGSIFSFERGRYFFKWPRKFRPSVRVNFGVPRVAGEIGPAALRQALSELGAEAFAKRDEVNQPIERALIDALKRNPLRVRVADYGPEPVRMRGVELLAGSLALADRLKRTASDRHIGILLPPGAGGALANLAVLFAGKVPVNLNPTCGAACSRHVLESAGIRTVISAEAVRRRVKDFPWPARTLDLREELGRISNMTKALCAIGVLILPARLLAAFSSRRNPGETALLLFTSGTSGAPKGVALTGRNLLGNTAQVDELGLLRKAEVFLSGLPLFHCFGLTLGLFLPILTGRKVATVPAPFDAKAIARAAVAERATVLAGTPTFLKGYLRKIPAEALATLRFAISGAEKLPATLAKQFLTHFGVPVLEGYGLTETSPVVALNQLDPAQGIGANSCQSGGQFGTAGRLAPGLAYRLIGIESGSPSASARGVLALRGINVIESYFGGLMPAERFRDGWFVTGDIVRIDEDGFVHIEGRTSRFSKIGGEMVPHGAIEEALADEDNPDHQNCVVGVASESGEEELVLLTTGVRDQNDVRIRLQAAGLPNLWIPRRVITQETLPMLASGKIDFAKCREIAAAEKPVAVA